MARHARTFSILGFVGIFGMAPHGEPARSPLRCPPRGTPLEEATSAATGLSKRPFLDSVTVEEAAAALSIVRQKYPHLKAVRDDEQACVIELWISDATGRELRRHARSIKTGYSTIQMWEIRNIKDPVIVELDRRFLAHDVTLMAHDDEAYVIRVQFPFAMDMDIVAHSYKRSPLLIGTAPFSSNLPTYSKVRISNNGPNWRIVFFEGRGDCPAGCAMYATDVLFDRKTHEASLVTADSGRLAKKL